MQSARLNIRTIVAKYIKDFPEEFADFNQYMKDRRTDLVDDDFGVVKGYRSEGANVIERALFEMPTTLHAMLAQNLSDEQLKWFKEGGLNKKDGARWFAKTFPPFRLPDKV